MKHKHFTFLLALLMSMATSSASAYDAKVNGICYNLNEETQTASIVISGGGLLSGVAYPGASFSVTTRSSNYSGDVVLPETIEYNEKTYCVNSIEKLAFSYSKLTSVVIPNSITYIADEAFQGCWDLTSITIPSSIDSIGSRAFAYCSSLSQATILCSPTSIGTGLFRDCIDLVDVSFDTKVITPLFQGLKAIKSVHLTNKVEHIQNNAFSYCTSLSSINIPNTVSSIGSFAFNGCSNLTSIGLPSCLTSLEPYVFANCSALTSIEIPNKVSSIGEVAFAGCNGLSSIIIPEGVISIGESAFESCTGLASITIPNSVTDIGSYAFAWCESLASVDIPNKISIIDSGTFYGCTALTSIVIPNNVETINDYAFYGCNGLITIDIGNGIRVINSEAFSSCSNLKEVYCRTETGPSTYSNAFDGSMVEYATLYVLENMIEVFRLRIPWGNFGTIKKIISSDLDPLPVVATIDLQDGNSYTTDLSQYVQTLTYTRTFTNTEWQALYVPFEMQYSDWSADFDVARLNDVHQWDDDDDGTIDRTALEIVKLKSGKTEANTPYLIRAKATGEYTFTLTNATLYKAEEKSFDVSSWNTKFTFTGTYSGVSGTDMFTNGYYAMGGGRLIQAESSSVSLSPYRWYMIVTDRNGNPKGIGEVKLMVFGEEETDNLAPTLSQGEGEKEGDTFDLSGQKISHSLNSSFSHSLPKGVYVRNGKKFVVK